MKKWLFQPVLILLGIAAFVALIGLQEEYGNFATRAIVEMIVGGFVTLLIGPIVIRSR